MSRSTLTSVLFLITWITTVPVTRAAEAKEALPTAGAGIEFWIERYAGGRDGPQRVSSDYRFCDGDRIALQLRADRDIHVAAFVRTIDGDPEALAKVRDGGIAAFRDEVRRQRTTPNGGWRLLFAPGGRGRRLSADQVLTLPASDPLILDDTPELRKVALVVSERELDLAPYLEDATGSDLQTKLARWEGNTVTSYATGGEIESYAFAVDPSRPGAVDVTVSHYPCSRRMSLSRPIQQFGGGWQR